MKTASVNYSPNFGHSFRVSICLKNANDIGETFVYPGSNKKLYRELNSKIVGWLNEDYLSELRQIYGIRRKVKKAEPKGDIHHKLVEELKAIDPDYARFSYTRSEHNGGKLGYIVTGVDVPIIENLKGAKTIGIAKADTKWYTGASTSDYVRSLAKLVKDNILEYVKNNNILLRSNNNKEIMLRAVFKETGKNSKGKPLYELDRFEFHENRTLPTLPKVSQEFLEYKYNPSMDKEIKTTVRYHIDRIMGVKGHFRDADQFVEKAKKNR